MGITPLKSDTFTCKEMVSSIVFVVSIPLFRGAGYDGT